MPYRELDLGCLDSISPLKPKCPVEDGGEDDNEPLVDEQGFTKVKVSKASIRRKKALEKQKVFLNITNFLNGFSNEKDN